MSHEEAFVKAFIEKGKQKRYAQLLSNPKRRSKILDRLNHNFDYDPTFASLVPNHIELHELLTSRGAPEMCHVIADVHELDNQDISLTTAISELSTHSFGYLISCIAGRLAYYQPESPADGVLLERRKIPNQSLQLTAESWVL